jgi:hypothetical protein
MVEDNTGSKSYREPPVRIRPVLKKPKGDTMLERGGPAPANAGGNETSMTQQAELVKTWCPTCGTMHDDDDECPGELLATGPERHGWRVLVDTPRGPEVYGTLVAPAGDHWRARVLTYPNVLWIVGRGNTMKFVGSTPALVEQAAIRFIKGHCKSHGFTARTEVPAVESGEVAPEQDATAARSEAVRASQRQLRAVRVAYGLGRPNQEAETDDLSEGGLFIRTDEPMPVGTDLQLRLEAEGFGIPLRGVVRWARDVDVNGRPRGMGIKLVNPHPRYIHFVRQQQNQAQPTGDTTTYEVEEWKAADLLEEVEKPRRRD